MENFEAQHYRKNLTEKLKSSEKNARIEILNKAKQTPDYASAKHFHLNESLEQAKFPYESTQTIEELAEQIRTANKNDGIEQSAEELQIEAQMQWDYLESLKGLSVENINEILEKTVDIYKEHDLKFKDVWGMKNLASFLRAGVLGEVIQESVPKDVLIGKQGERNNLFSYRDKIKKAKNVRDGYVNGEGMGYNYNTGNEGFPFESKNEPGQRGNVYYPEGFIKFIEALSIPGGDLNSSSWSKTNAYNCERGLEPSSKSTIRKLKKDLLVSIPLPDEARTLLKDIGLDISTYLELVETEKDAELVAKLKELWPKMRDIILRDLIESSLPANRYKYHNGHTVENFHADFPMELGLIFSSKTKVLLKPHSDFSTQGVIMELRASPRDIMGIFINDEGSSRQSRSDSLAGMKKDKEKQLQGKIKRLLEYETLSTEEKKKIENLSVYGYLLQQARKNKLPIYNLKGDLLWPQKLSHEEIVKGMNKNSEITEMQK